MLDAAPRWSAPLKSPLPPLHLWPLVCAALCCGGLPPAWADESAGLPGVLSLGAGQGLPQQTVFALASDAPGHVWVGTQDGLARWDGRRFERFPLPGDVRDWVTHLEWVDDTLWVGTDRSGLYQWRADTLTPVVAPQGVDWPPIEALAVARAGGVWVGTPQGLNHCRGAVCTEVAAARGLEVAEVLDAPDGTLWVGTNVDGLYTFQRTAQGDWVRAALHLERTDGLPNSAIRALAQDPQGRIWIGTGRGLARWDGHQVQRWTEHRGTPIGGVYDLLPLADGTLLAALWGGGLGRWSNDDAVLVYSFAEGLPDRYLQTLLATGDTRAPILWMGSGASGVLRIEAGRWRSFDERHGLPQRVVVGVGELAPTESGTAALWAGTLGGSVRQQGTAWVPLLPAPYAQRVVYDLVVQADGTRWYGTDRGVLRERAGQFREYTSESDGVPATAVEHLLQRPDGLWLGTGHGIARIVEDRLQRLHGDDPTQAELAVRSWLPLADGAVLIGSGDGLLRSDGSHLQRLHPSCNGHGITYDLEWIGTAASATNAPSNDTGALWLGTRLGVLVLHGDPAGVHHCEALPEPGPGPRTVYELVSDAAGRVYLFGYDGVRVYDPALGPAQDPAAWSHAGRADGLPALEFNRDALRDADGRIWAASTGGLVALDPMARSQPPSAPTLHTAMTVAGAVLGDGEVLPARHGEIEVRPRLLSFRAEHRIRYRSWLEGLEDGWSEWRSDVDHRYSRLPAGGYRHHVQARDAAGTVWSAPVLSFRVAEPLWRHPLTLSVAALLLVLAGLALGRWRARTLARRAAHLEALVAERTRALETLSSTDPLTGAWNRRHFHRQVQTWMTHSAAHGGVILALVDLDHFKHINDECGHAAGDAVLVAVAACLRSTDAHGAQVVRWGGEEFLLVLPHAAVPTPALRLETLRRAVAETVQVPGASDRRVSVSIGYGIADTLLDGPALERMLHAVDAALYRAKRGGRNRVVAVDGAEG